jgi:hypothetical protein
MNKKLILILTLLTLVLSGCHIPLKAKEPTPEPLPSPTLERMTQYFGDGIQLMLPRSFVEEDVKTALPSIIETITNVVGSTDGFAGDLIKDLEGNVAWYGFDGGSPAIYPTRLIIIKNKSLSGFPIGIVTIGLETILNNNSTQVDRDNLTLGGRDVIRFTYAKEANAWAAYIFKEEGRLWINVFITTPANMVTALADFDTSIDTIHIDPILE